MKVLARTDAQHEVVERLVVDVHECDLHGQSEVCQVCQVLPALSVRLLLLLSHKTDIIICEVQENKHSLL